MASVTVFCSLYELSTKCGRCLSRTFPGDSCIYHLISMTCCITLSGVSFPLHSPCASGHCWCCLPKTGPQHSCVHLPPCFLSRTSFDLHRVYERQAISLSAVSAKDSPKAEHHRLQRCVMHTGGITCGIQGHATGQAKQLP